MYFHEKSCNQLQKLREKMKFCAIYRKFLKIIVSGIAQVMNLAGIYHELDHGLDHVREMNPHAAGR